MAGGVDDSPTRACHHPGAEVRDCDIPTRLDLLQDLLLSMSGKS